MRKFYLSLCLLLPLVGCSTHYSETKQVANVAYIQITGQTQGVTITLDNQVVDMQNLKTFKLDNQTVTTFETSVGMHVIQVSKNGQLVIHRQFFVSQGNTFEIRVP